MRAAAEHQAGGHKPVERGNERLFITVRYCSQEFIGEFTSDGGAHLRDPFAVVEPIESGQQRGMQCRWYQLRDVRLDWLTSATLACGEALDHGGCQLFDKKRNPIGSRQDQLLGAQGQPAI